MRFNIGDKVLIETKHMGPWEGHVGAVDADGGIVVRHDLKKYPDHPSGATYISKARLWDDVELLCPVGGTVTINTWDARTGESRVVTHKGLARAK